MLKSLHKNHKAYTWLTLLLVVVFVTVKLNDLHLPYFWDELGVYSRAGLYLAEHGLSLLPSSLPPELSRGHPLLFQFLSGGAYVVFGKSVLTGHMFALVITITLLFVFYRQVSIVFSKLVAFCAVALLMVQPVFVAQSTLVLPEMMLALLVFLSIALFYRRKYAGFAVCASLALLVKESAIVLPFVVLAFGLLQLLVGNRKDYLQPRALLFVFLPLVVFAIFLVIQRIQNGWFFFPEHVGYISFDFERMLEYNHGYQRFLFFEQGRYWWVKALLIGGLAGFVKGGLKPKGFVGLSIVLVLSFLAFSSINFYMNRYMLPVLPFLTCLVVVSLYAVSHKFEWMLLVTIVLSVLCLKDLDPGYFNYDCDMGYKHHLAVEQKVLDKFCEIDNGQAEIKADFPLYFALSEPQYTGFRGCTVSTNRLKPKGALRLYTTGVGAFPDTSADVKLIYSATDGYAEGRIYKYGP